MAVTPSNAYEDQFLRNYDLTPAQRRSRLMQCCMPVEEFTTGEVFHYNRIGEVEGETKTGRYAKTPVNPAPHDKRLGYRQVKQANIPVDRADLRRMVADPKSKYVERLRQAQGKSFDDDVIGTLGAAATRKDHGTATTQVILPATQKIAAGNTGLTLDKLLETAEKFDNAEVGDIEENPRHFIVGSRQVRNLLSLEQVTSADYNEMKTLMKGKVIFYMGFYFIRSERLEKDGNNRLCYALTSDAIVYGSDQELTVLRIAEMQAHSFDWSVYAEWEVGSIRTDESRVVQIACQE